MADPSLPTDGWSLFAYLLGSGGVGMIATAIVGKVTLGKRSEAAVIAAPVAQTQAQVESTPLSIHIIRIDLNVASLKETVAALVQQCANMSMQLNTYHALLERERQDRMKAQP